MKYQPSQPIAIDSWSESVQVWDSKSAHVVPNSCFKEASQQTAPQNTEHIHTLSIINEIHEADTARIETWSQILSQLLL